MDRETPHYSRVGIFEDPLHQRLICLTFQATSATPGRCERDSREPISINREAQGSIEESTGYAARPFPNTVWQGECVECPRLPERDECSRHVI
jgi:hypothetical protein